MDKMSILITFEQKHTGVTSHKLKNRNKSYVLTKLLSLIIVTRSSSLKRKDEIMSMIAL